MLIGYGGGQMGGCTIVEEKGTGDYRSSCAWRR